MGDSLAVAALEPRKRRGKGGADIEPFVFVVLTDSIAKKTLSVTSFVQQGRKEAKRSSAVHKQENIPVALSKRIWQYTVV